MRAQTVGRIFKWMGTREQARELWENPEALGKYLAHLKHLMMGDPNARMYEGETDEDAAKRATIYNEAVKRGLVP